jgi:hypothetical protein
VVGGGRGSEEDNTGSREEELEDGERGREVGAEEDDPKVKCMFWKILTSGVALFLS